MPGKDKLEKLYDEVLRTYVAGLLGRPIPSQFRSPRMKVVICNRGCAEKYFRQAVSELEEKAEKAWRFLGYTVDTSSVVKLFYESILPDIANIYRCIYDEELGMDACVEVIEIGYGYMIARFEDKYIEAVRRAKGDLKHVAFFVMVERYLLDLVRKLSLRLSLVTPVPLIIDYTVYIDNEEGSAFKIVFDIVPAPAYGNLMRDAYLIFTRKRRQAGESGGGSDGSG